MNEDGGLHVSAMFDDLSSHRATDATRDAAEPAPLRPAASPHGAAPAVDRPQPLDLSGLTLSRREPVRPAAARGPGFEEAYDGTTLFFDAFWTASDRILLIGPALNNLGPAVAAARITARPSGQACRFRIETLDRQARVVVRAPAGTTALVVESALARFMVPVGGNLSTGFRGRRVLLTLQKDNPVAWILDWVRYHRDRHGADAVLIYDNGSTAYGARDLAEALGTLDGIEAARVVSWPFKYGPQGSLTGGWDSDYCQLGALEHARWRYLAQARSVMNADIDEFVVAGDGSSAFARAEASPFGLVRYVGIWVMGIDGHEPPAGPDVRHRDYATRLRPRLRRTLLGPVDTLACFVKWTAVPSRCPPRAQWGVHRIAGWHASHLKTGRFTFRHFRQINTQWKYDRTVLERFDPERHVHDAHLAAECAKVRWTA